VLLLGVVGVANAADQTAEPMGASAGSMPGAPVCKDLGVTVSFSTGSSTLDVNAKGALDGVTKWMSSKGDRTVKLQGYADTTGNSEANVTLSEQRADAAKDYLISQGVSPSRISTVGRGEEHPEERALPNAGRTVTFFGCQMPVATAEATPPPAPEAVPAPEPVPEETPPPPVAAAPETTPQPQYEATPGYRPFYGSPFGFALLVGGGYSNFTGGNAKGLTSGGGSWDARIVAGTRSFIGFEAAYVGTANNVNVLGSTSSTLISNGVEGALRLNVPIVMGWHMIEPYGFIGLGWQNYKVTNNRPAFTDFNSGSDNVMTLPVGGGIAYTYKALSVDARAGWTATYYNNILLTTSGSNNLDHWGVGGHVGVAF
jgi:peptidoglycan-associated lipoprotein